MKLPEFNFNRFQSFIDFVTTLGKGKFGMEGTKLFYELIGGSKMFLAEGSSLAGSLPAGADPDTISVEEINNGRDFTTVLRLNNFPIGTMPGSATAKAIGALIYTFPAGNHLEECVYASLKLNAPGTAVVAPVGIGSVVASGAVAILTGTATFIDRSNHASITTADGGGTAVEALKNTTAGVQTGIALNVTGSVKSVFLNAAGTWNVNNGSGFLKATGTIVLKWTKMGI
jgi:hypothetical protein